MKQNFFYRRYWGSPLTDPLNTPEYMLEFRILLRTVWKKMSLYVFYYMDFAIVSDSLRAQCSKMSSKRVANNQ